MLYDDIVQFAREQGAMSLEIAIRDDARESLRFATRRGFTVEQRDVTQVAKNSVRHAHDPSGNTQNRSGAYLFVRELA
jgi:hypothetical protein